MVRILLAWTTWTAAQAAPPADWVYRLSDGAQTSHLVFVDHASLDPTSFEMQAIGQLVSRSCELLFDRERRPPLAAGEPFDRGALSLAARGTLLTLNLGDLGARDEPTSVGEAWRKIRVALNSHLSTQIEAYDVARTNDQSLRAFGPVELDLGYQLAAEYLLGSKFTPAALIEATEAWYEEHGAHWAAVAGPFRRWAEARLPRDHRRVVDLHAGLTAAPTLPKLNAALERLAEVLPASRTAANFWNHHVSLFLRNVLAQRHFQLSLVNYRLIRASLDWADVLSGAWLTDAAVTDEFSFATWADRIDAAVRAGGAVVVVDPQVALPHYGPTFLDALTERFDVRPLPLRGVRPRAVR